MSDARVPVTGGAKFWPVFDRHWNRIHVGDRLRVEHCVGRYGETRIEEMVVTDAHWPYCSHGPAHGYYDLTEDALRCYQKHNDWEHGHEAWAEIIFT